MSPRITTLDPLAAEDAERLGARLQDAHDGNTDAMLAEAWLMGRRVVLNAALGRRICRICGCWELHACEAGCSWVAADLCSACEPG